MSSLFLWLCIKILNLTKIRFHLKSLLCKETRTKKEKEAKIMMEFQFTLKI